MSVHCSAFSYFSVCENYLHLSVFAVRNDVPRLSVWNQWSDLPRLESGMTCLSGMTCPGYLSGSCGVTCPDLSVE